MLPRANLVVASDPTAEFAATSDPGSRRKFVGSERASAFGSRAVCIPDSRSDFRFNVKQRLTLDASAAKSNGIDRAAIAERISESTGRDISIHTIDGWLAESKETKNLPAGLLNAWADATESRIALEYVTSQHPALAKRLRLGEIAESIAALKSEQTKLLEVVA